MKKGGMEVLWSTVFVRVLVADFMRKSQNTSFLRSGNLTGET